MSELIKVFNEISNELKNHYLLAYTPTKEPDGSWREISLKVNRAGRRGPRAQGLLRRQAPQARRLKSRGGLGRPTRRKESRMADSRPGRGQTALVTGASGGIGVDLAACFARGGYDLILTARSEGALKDVAERLAREHGVAATPIANDLGRAPADSGWPTQIAARGLSVDVLVNNAGYGHAGAFTSSDRATQLGMIELNVGRSSS